MKVHFSYKKGHATKYPRSGVLHTNKKQYKTSKAEDAVVRNTSL